MVNVTLLIDDSDIDLFIQRRFLEVYQFSKTLVSHKSAEEALHWLADQGADAPPDVIFLDLNMPKIDGFGFLERFTQLPDQVTSTCKIVILSSSNSRADIERAKAYKNTIEFITKPIKQTDIESLKSRFA